MEIKKYKKDRNNTYKVYIDDEVITLYDDVIIKYNLLCNKIIDKDKFNEIIDYNDFLNGYYRSINCINKKLRTELEIRKYLTKLEIKSKEIDKIIKLLYKDGYLNKKVYLKAYINDQYNLTNNGPEKIKKDLINLGYSIDEIVKYLYKLDWDIRIEKILNKKIKQTHKLSNNMLKTKLLNDIIKLGYEKESILYYLEKTELDSDEDILVHEYKKIKNKYEKKYSGNELQYKIINYLYKKGFEIENIKRCVNEN